MKVTSANIDEYISEFPEPTQAKLKLIRTAIKEAAPPAEEAISYAMPAFRLNGILVYFAGYANHIGFYPGAGAIAAFSEDLTMYKSAKGSVQFPLDQPLPLELIKRIVRFRIDENLERIRNKEKKQK